MPAQLPPAQQAALTGRSFFPQLISGPFLTGLHAAFDFAIEASLSTAWASWMRGGPYVYTEGDEVDAEGDQEIGGAPYDGYRHDDDRREADPAAAEAIGADTEALP